MKIHQTSRLGAANPYQKLEQQAVKKSGNAGKQRDEVLISPEAKKLAAGTSVRHEKIESLKNAVSDGTYKVDAQKLAEKLLSYFKGQS